MYSETLTFQSTRHMSHAIHCPVLLLLPTANCHSHRQPNTVIAETSLNAVILVKTLRACPECA